MPSPIGAFLQQIGVGLPALGQAHREREQQDIEMQQRAAQIDSLLRSQQLQQLTSLEDLAQRPTQRARESYNFANQVDPLGAFFTQGDTLAKAGYTAPDGYVPPDKALALRKNEMMSKLFSGGGSSPSSPGGDAASQRMMYRLLGFDPDEIIGPASEPTVNIQTVRNGASGTWVAPRSAATSGDMSKGTFYPAQPTGGLKSRLVDAQNALATLDRIKALRTPGKTGPVQGRWSEIRQYIPGLGDSNSALLGAEAANFKNTLMRAISGAAIGQGNEQTRLRAQIPEMLDPDTVWDAKMSESERDLRTLIDLIQGGNVREGVDPFAATPQGSAPAATPASAAGKILSMQQVAAVAAKNGWTPEQAAQMAQAEGWTIQ